MQFTEYGHWGLSTDNPVNLAMHKMLLSLSINWFLFQLSISNTKEVIDVYFCTIFWPHCTNCKKFEVIVREKRPKKNVASSVLLRTFDMLFYDFQSINGQKLSLIIFYSTYKPVFTRLLRLWSNEHIYCSNAASLTWRHVGDASLEQKMCSFLQSLRDCLN